VTEEELMRKIETLPDFIAVRRAGYSLRTLARRYPDGVPDKVCAAALKTTEEDITARWARILGQLREKMLVEVPTPKETP
jgi:hypothetical protein